MYTYVNLHPKFDIEQKGTYQRRNVPNIKNTYSEKSCGGDTSDHSSNLSVEYTFLAQKLKMSELCQNKTLY